MAEQLTLTPDLDERAGRASYSSLTLHRTCPQAWLYRYGYRLEQDREGSSVYAALGSWWSVLRAAESLERGREAGTLIADFVPKKLEVEKLEFLTEGVTVQRVLSALDSAWDRQSSEHQDEFIEAFGEPMPNRIRSMYALWSKSNADRADREAPLGVEIYIEREFPQTAVDGKPPIKVVGFIDELYHDRDRGMVVIRDHKTSKSLSNASGAYDDMMDSQLQLYAWIAGPMLKEKGLSPARAVAYDRTRTVAPKTPALTQTGGTLSKSTTDYDLATYWAWAATDTATPAIEAWLEENPDTPEAVAEAMREMPGGPIWGKVGEFFQSGAKAGQGKFGVYEIEDKVIEALSTPEEQAKWHSRTLKPIQKNVVAAHLRSAVDSAQDIRRTQSRAERSGEAPRNLTRRGCQFCDFADLCRAQMIGGTEGEYDLPAMGLRVREKKDA